MTGHLRHPLRRTSRSFDQTFGLLVFEADDEAAARPFMEADPAVMAGVMTATLHPYAVALSGDERRRPSWHPLCSEP